MYKKRLGKATLDVMTDLQRWLCISLTRQGVFGCNDRLAGMDISIVVPHCDRSLISSEEKIFLRG